MRPALLWLCAVVPLAAQEPALGIGTTARTGVVLDAYFFGSGFAFHHVVEWTVPVALSQRFGSRLTVDLSSAYAHASGATTSGALEVSGFTDTDIRASWAAGSGRLIVSVAATLPTGKTAVSDSSVPLLSALATDLLAFTTPGFGSGGGATGGFATAFRLGERWAGGLGGSYHWRAGYVPVMGIGELRPGGEGRVRLGVEGPFGEGGYFRGAAVYTTSGGDVLGDSSQSATGDRVLMYSAVSVPAGRSSVSFYGYDMYRLRPRAYPVRTPRGNVLALGTRLERPLSPVVTLAPNVEFRHEVAALGGDRLQLLGWLVRPGLDVRYRAGGAVTVLVQGQAALGRLAETTSSVSVVGPRAVVLVEWTR